MLRSVLASLSIFLCFSIAPARQLQPGFDAAEYQELLKVFTSFMGGRGTIPKSERFSRVYRSEVMGLDNLWELHMDADGVAVVSIRGTTRSSISWMENAYAAMTPARGTLRLGDGADLEYDLARDPNAAVHIGWLVGMAYLQRDILPKLDSLARAGVQDVLVFGHSQGAGIAFLLTAHLLNLQERGVLPAGLRIKTYCSAGPKPGNLYFAYDYEHRTRGGWAYNVVNALDWVPEVPVTIQTTDDLNAVNPFVDSRALIGRQPLLRRMVLKRIYNRLDKPSRRAQRNYEKYLGRAVGKHVQKQLPGYEPGEFASTTNYVRTGTTIVLMPDADYLKLFPQDTSMIFIHHMLEPYMYLAGKYESEGAVLDVP